MVLLEKPTDDSVEIAVNFTKECGQILTELASKPFIHVLDRFRTILHEGEIDKRVQYTIEGLFAVQRAGFKEFPAVHTDLDLVESDDQITHELSLDDDTMEREEHLDVFHYDPNYDESEKLWASIRREILGAESSESSSGGDGSASESGSDEEQDEEEDVDRNKLVTTDISDM
jgi:pre-mRNA-splicing factor CWC22